jgi:hypothetical protein
MVVGLRTEGPALLICRPVVAPALPVVARGAQVAA